jgi:hypothetical protein
MNVGEEGACMTPETLTWLDLRILEYLTEHKHPVALQYMRDHLEPNMENGIVIRVMELAEMGFLNIKESEATGQKMVELNERGRALAWDVVLGQRGCPS